MAVRYDRKQVRSCKTCAHFEDAPSPPPYASDCKTRFAKWYPQRGYAPCPHYQEQPLTADDYA